MTVLWLLRAFDTHNESVYNVVLYLDCQLYRMCRLKTVPIWRSLVVCTMEHEIFAIQQRNCEHDAEVSVEGIINNREDLLKCHFKSCDFKTKHQDNLKLHIDQKHHKILKRCEKCGKSMTASSLSRHKEHRTCYSKNSCMQIGADCSPTESVIASNQQEN